MDRTCALQAVGSNRLTEAMGGAWLRYMTVIRLVDIFVLEGHEALLRAALGLLTMLRTSLTQVGAPIG